MTFFRKGANFNYPQAQDFPELTELIPYFAMFRAHPCCWPRLSGKKIFCFNFLIQFFIYLHLEPKLIIVFQGIILHTDIVTASRLILLMHKHK